MTDHKSRILEAVDKRALYEGYDEQCVRTYSGDILPIITALLDIVERQTKALEEIRDLDPYPSSEANIRLSHERHRNVAKHELAATQAEIERLAGSET